MLADVESSPFDERHKALFRFIDKVNLSSPDISAADVADARSAGWTDDALFFAITVCALFNFYNRWIDASGVHVMSEESHCKYGLRTAQNGYLRRK